MKAIENSNPNMGNFEELLEKVSKLSDEEQEKVSVFAQGVLAMSELRKKGA